LIKYSVFQLLLYRNSSFNALMLLTERKERQQTIRSESVCGRTDDNGRADRTSASRCVDDYEEL